MIGYMVARVEVRFSHYVHYRSRRLIIYFVVRGEIFPFL